jgi:hypothetical protein
MEILPVLVPAVGSVVMFGSIVACCLSCTRSRLAALEERIQLLESQSGRRQEQRYYVPPTPQQVYLPLTYHRYQAPNVPYTPMPSAPAPSAPPAFAPRASTAEDPASNLV